MNRYFLYIMLLNMLMNGIVFIPKILIQYRYEGAVSGVLIAIPIGLTFMFFFTKAISKFPGKGLPDLLEDSKHRLIKILILGSMPFFWFTAGLITLIGYIDIINRFINPEMSKLWIAALYLAAIFMIIRQPTQRVMYILEIVLFLNMPLIMFIVAKAITGDYLSWDSILEVGTHVFTKPKFTVIGTAEYVFAGYGNLIIFNRVIKEKIKLRNIILIFFLGFFNLFTTFLIPIGYHGSDGAQEYLYPWISTSDSLRLVYSPIERVLFLFLMFYMSITLLSISIHWHVSLELLKGVFKKKSSPKREWYILGAYAGCAMIAVYMINTVLLNKITIYWMMLRFGFEFCLVSTFFLWARRKAA